MSSYGAYPTPAPSYGAPVVGVDPTAVMGRRIGAYLIDLVLITIVAIVIVIGGFFAFKPYDKVTGLASYSGGSSQWCSDNYNSTDASNSGGFCFDTNDDTAYVVKGNDVGALYGLLIGAEAICWLLDYVLLQGLTGASVGKLLVGLRVVKHDGEICGLGRALARTVLLIVDANLCVLIGLLTSLMSKGHRRVGDMAASTLVVPKAQVGRPVVVPGLTAPEFGSPYPGGGYPPPSFQQPSYQPPSYQQPAPTPPSDPQQAGWAEPNHGDAPQAQEPAAPAGAPNGDGPHWDEARNAYITYDRSRGAWLEYDQASGNWGPISQ